MGKTIFTPSNDLPEITKKLIGKPKIKALILELLKISGRPLTSNELIIGLQKKYQYTVTSRQQVLNALTRLIDSGKVVKKTWDTWALK